MKEVKKVKYIVKYNIRAPHVQKFNLHKVLYLIEKFDRVDDVVKIIANDWNVDKFCVELVSVYKEE